jgi:hypothetical protein
MREPVVVLEALQRSPPTPAVQRLMPEPVQTLASGVQVLMSRQVLLAYWMLQVRRGSTQLLAGAAQVLPVKSHESFERVLQSLFDVQLLPAFLHLPPQVLTVVQVLVGSSEQTFGRVGHWLALAQPPLGVVPKAQVPPLVANEQSLVLRQPAVVLPHTPVEQSVSTAQLLLP